MRVDFGYLAKRTDLSIINNASSRTNRVLDQVYMVGAAFNYLLKKLILDPFYAYAYLGEEVITPMKFLITVIELLVIAISDLTQTI